jgi:hypothetical protein
VNSTANPGIHLACLTIGHTAEAKAWLHYIARLAGLGAVSKMLAARLAGLGAVSKMLAARLAGLGAVSKMLANPPIRSPCGGGAWVIEEGTP